MLKKVWELSDCSFSLNPLMFKQNIQSTRKKLIKFHIGHMRFVEKRDCKLSVSKWQCQWPYTYKIKSIFLLSLDFIADSSRCSRMLSNLL